MGFSKGRISLTLQDILDSVPETVLLAHYLGIYKVPTVICSPFRQDRKPSFGLYSPDGRKILFRDMATNERGSLFTLLGKLWGNISYDKVLDRINKDLSNMSVTKALKKVSIISRKQYSRSTDIKIKKREWKDYDIAYWKSFGISLDWLNYAEVYPISHKIVIKGNKEYVLGADKYAYAYVEHKEGKDTIKIYQPFNTKGFKWSNKHDKSVISLWTKVPKTGFIICICSSLKDALCLWANTNIPSIAIQGEGYSMSETAIKELKKRFTNICIMLDNDEVGLKDAEKLSKETGFINVILPSFEGGKDISDLMKSLNGDVDKFREIVIPLFKTAIKDTTI